MSNNEPWLPGKHVLDYNDYELEIAFKDIPARGYDELQQVLRYYDKESVRTSHSILHRILINSKFIQKETNKIIERIIS